MLELIFALEGNLLFSGIHSHFNTDDDCERRLQRLREVAAGVKTVDFTKYASSSRSCEADDEFEEDKGGRDEDVSNPDEGEIEEEDDREKQEQQEES